MLKRLWDKACMRFAWLLPERVVMWASIRLMAHATQGEWGNESPCDVSVTTALKRWPV